MRKKLTSIILAMTLSFSLVACFNNGDDTENTTKLDSSESTSTTVEEEPDATEDTNTSEDEEEDTTSTTTVDSSVSEEFEEVDGIYTIEKVSNDSLEPVTLYNESGIYTHEEVARYFDDFLELLRAGDPGAVAYLSYKEADSERASVYTNTYLPSVFADEEASKFAVEYFNRILVDARDYALSDYDRPLDVNDNDAGDVVQRHNVIGTSLNGYEAVLSEEEIAELVNPIRDEALNNYNAWRPVHSYVINKIQVHDLNRYKLNGALTLIKNEDDSLSINSVSFYENLAISGLPFVYNSDGDLIWNYQYLFRNLRTVYSEDIDYSLYPKLEEYLELYNAGDLLILFDTLSSDMGSNFTLNRYRDKVGMVDFFYDKREISPQLHLKGDDSIFTLVGANPAWEMYTSQESGDTFDYVISTAFETTIRVADNDSLASDIQNLFIEILEPISFSGYNSYIENMPQNYYR